MVRKTESIAVGKSGLMGIGVLGQPCQLVTYGELGARAACQLVTYGEMGARAACQLVTYGELGARAAVLTG